MTNRFGHNQQVDILANTLGRYALERSFESLRFRTFESYLFRTFETHANQTAQTFETSEARKAGREGEQRFCENKDTEISPPTLKRTFAT